MEKSYNVIAVKLLDALRCGYGLNQAMRKVEIEKSELAICLNRNPELAKLVSERFKITVESLSQDEPNTQNALDEEELREKARKLGIRYAGTLGIEKLKAQIEAVEAKTQPAPANPEPNAPTPDANAAADDAGANANDEGAGNDKTGQDEPNTQNADNTNGAADDAGAGKVGGDGE